MGLYALFFKKLHNVVGHFVVDNALACNRALFDAVESRCIVLIGNDNAVGSVGCENLFCLAFVKLSCFFHFCVPPACYYLLNLSSIFLFAAKTFSVAASLAAASFSASAPSETARICTDNKAALTAPSIATVATGMPAGI